MNIKNYYKKKDTTQIYFEKSDLFSESKKCILVKLRMFSFLLIFQNTFQIIAVLRTM